MKEMVYQSTRLNPPVVLGSGEYKRYNYYVLNLGTHPCGYVEIPSESKYFNVDYDNIPIECHGGLTYGRGFLHTVADANDNRYFIGWDYAHYGDFVGYRLGGFDEITGFYDMRYTTDDVVRECKNVINQLIELANVPDINVGK